MFIYKISNLSQLQIKKGVTCNAKLNNRGQLVQDEFARLTNNLIEGIPTYIKGVEVKPSYSPMPKCGYISVNVQNRTYERCIQHMRFAHR